jgi:hypothetical protein
MSKSDNHLMFQTIRACQVTIPKAIKKQNEIIPENNIFLLRILLFFFNQYPIANKQNILSGNNVTILLYRTELN